MLPLRPHRLVSGGATSAHRTPGALRRYLSVVRNIQEFSSSGSSGSSSSSSSNSSTYGNRYYSNLQSIYNNLKKSNSNSSSGSSSSGSSGSSSDAFINRGRKNPSMFDTTTTTTTTPINYDDDEYYYLGTVAIHRSYTLYSTSCCMALLSGCLQTALEYSSSSSSSSSSNGCSSSSEIEKAQCSLIALTGK